MPYSSIAINNRRRVVASSHAHQTIGVVNWNSDENSDGVEAI